MSKQITQHTQESAPAIGDSLIQQRAEGVNAKYVTHKTLKHIYAPKMRTAATTAVMNAWTRDTNYNGGDQCRITASPTGYIEIYQNTDIDTWELIGRYQTVISD